MGADGDEGFEPGALLNYIEAGNASASPAGEGQGGQNLDGSSFAGTVGTQKPENFPGPDLEGQVLQGRDVPVIFAQVFDGDHVSLGRVDVYLPESASPPGCRNLRPWP